MFMIAAAIKQHCIDTANELLSKYPQYKNHFDSYVLIQIRKDIKTKTGVAFKKDEYTIAKPEVRIVTGTDGKTRNLVTAFSFSNVADTSIPVVDVSFIEHVPLKITPIN